MIFARLPIIIRRAAVLIVCLATPAALQAAENDDIPRAADGRPDFNGIWQAIGSAHYDIEPHAADFGPLPETGAIGAIPAGLGIVIGEEIPYTPEARAQQQANKADWLALDPVVKCYMPGIPRANYLPFPFQIIQSPDHVVFAYEFASASRIGYVNQPDFEAPIYTWMGHNLVSFEGDAMIIEVTDQVPETWFDHAGNHHTEGLRVTERFTHLSRDVLLYEATLEDPAVYTEPWTVRMPLYRRLDEGMQLLELKCVEFTEELLYGHLRRQPDADN